MGDAAEGNGQGSGVSDDVRNAAYEALARATHTVVADFGRRLDDLTATVRSDAEIRRDLVPPKSVAAAGRRLTGAQRRAVRDAIDEVITSQQADIERSLGSDTTEAPPEERLPMTPDLVAMVIEYLLGDGDPTGRLEAVLVDLMERYPAGREYVGQYIVWRVGIGAPNAVTSAAYQGAVSEFESLLGALLRLVAVVEPARIGGHRFDEDAHQADPKAYIHDLIWHYADAVGDAMRGGNKKWMELITSAFGADVLDLVPDPDALTEVYQRRNVLAHRGGVADPAYVKATGRTDSIGSPLTPDVETFAAAVALLDALGTQLAACWLHAVRNDVPVDRTLAWRALTRQLDAEEWSLARSIALGICADIDWGDDVDPYRVNTWMARLLSDDPDADSIRREIRAWDVAAGSDLAIAKACLLFDESEAVAAVQSYATKGGDLWAIADWPLAKQMSKRSNRFRAAVRPRSVQRPIT